MKLHRSRIFFSLLLLLLLAAYAAPVTAQAGITLDSVRVDIWPEYDQPSVLVIYHITLDPSVPLPAAITMRIPAAAGRPHAVAWQSPDQSLFDINYELSAAGEWVEVRFTTPMPDVRIEYYDPSLTKDGSQRAFTFRWLADYTVQNLTLLVQQPFNASGMVLEPEAGSGREASDGLTYFTKVAGKANAGMPVDLTIRYTKPDDALSHPQQFQAAEANQPVDSATAGRVRLDQVLPWAVGGAGLALIAGGLLWYWRMGTAGRTAAASARRPGHRHAARQSAGSAPAKASEGDSFCHHCGKKSAPGDVFCRSCGTKLR